MLTFIDGEPLKARLLLRGPTVVRFFFAIVKKKLFSMIDSLTLKRD